MEISQIKSDLDLVLNQYFEKVDFPENGVFVVGCSTSEIVGSWKGTNSRLDVGQAVVEEISKFLRPRNINLAIQGCEHINRSLLVEQAVAERHNWEVVSVVPAIHAGGGTQVAAYEKMTDPVEVEHISAFGGIDIGGTEIGMHVKFVQIPVPIENHKVGEANIVCLKSRPKLVGGIRARYDFTAENKQDYKQD